MPEMAEMTGSRFLAEALHGYGVTHVFLVPFVFSPALAAMEDLSIRRVSTHSELSAAYMADGYARAARRPGICMAQAIGSSNMVAGLRDAWLGRSPVIALTAGHYVAFRYKGLYQEIEDFGMFEPVTKANVCLEKADRLPDLLRQAFRVATTGAPGPVHLRVLGRVGEGMDGPLPGISDSKAAIEPQFGRYPAYRPAPDPSAVEEAAHLLAIAARPVIVAGGGVTASEAALELVALAEKLSIPVVTSLTGKEAIPDTHPLAVGLVGSYGRSCANQLIAEADLVFFAGSRAGGMTTERWTAPPVGTPAIQLDIDPAEIGRNYPAQVGLVGDAKVTLRRLIDSAPRGAHTAWVERAQDGVRTWRAKIAAQAKSDVHPMRPERICQEITQCLPPEAVVVSDTGHAAIWSGTMINLRHAGQRYIRSAGSLGWGFPGAMGVKCALPDRPVLCFIGDGGMFYHVAELETAARFGINLVVVVNNNAALSQTMRGFTKAYGGTQRGRAHEMWRYRDVNFAKVAQEMGCFGVRVERPEQLRPALEQAFAAGRPAVIDAVSEVEALPLDPWS